MPKNQNVDVPDDIYDDPEVQAALNRLEAALDEGIERARRRTLREILGFSVKPRTAGNEVQVQKVSTDAEARSIAPPERHTS